MTTALVRTDVDTLMPTPNYSLPPPVYLPSSGGHTSSRLVSEPFHRRVFAFRRYSFEEDGRLVARTRNAGRDCRHQPYERSSRPSPAHPSSQDASSTSSQRKQVDAITMSQLFQQLVPLSKDPSNFESTAAAVCASFDLDPTTTTEIVNLFKQQSPVGGAPGPSSGPPVKSGPTVADPNSIIDPPVDTPRASNSADLSPAANSASLSTPFKQQRPFSSGSPGVTTWYTTSSVDGITSPPPGLGPEVGELYVHHHRVTDIYHVWLYGIDRRWKCVTNQEKVYHPAIDDRVLSMRSNGTPNWITAASFTTIRGRKGKSRGVA